MPDVQEQVVPTQPATETKSRWDFLRRFRRNSNTKPESSPTTVAPQSNPMPEKQYPLALPPVEQENSYLKTRKEVNQTMLSIYQNLDAKIAKQIGFNGSILDTLFSAYKGVDRDDRKVVKTLPLELQKNMYGTNNFHYRVEGANKGEYLFYEIDPFGYQHIEAVTQAGALDIVTHARPERPSFELSTIKRTFPLEPGNDGQRSLELTTYQDDYDPSRPPGRADIPMIVVESDGYRALRLEYDRPDQNGNVRLRNDQFIVRAGRYDESTGTVSPDPEHPSAPRGPVHPGIRTNRTDQTIEFDLKDRFDEKYTRKMPVNDNVHSRIAQAVRGFV